MEGGLLSPTVDTGCSRQKLPLSTNHGDHCVPLSLLFESASKELQHLWALSNLHRCEF